MVGEYARASSLYDRLSTCRRINKPRQANSLSYYDALRSVLEGRLSFSFVLPATCRLVVNRSTARRVAPARALVLAVFNNTRNGRVASRILKHLRASSAIVLCIVIDKWNALRIVIVARLLTIRTTWFRVDH